MFWLYYNENIYSITTFCLQRKQWSGEIFFLFLFNKVYINSNLVSVETEEGEVQ